MLHHQKAEDGNGKLNRGIARHFDPPTGDFGRWHYLAQVVQARAVAAGIEHWRSHWPVCAGTVVWQLNDCWPVSSWAAIDGDGRTKPLYHELRRVYADRLLTLQPGADGPTLAVINQSGETWRTTVSLRRLRADGGVMAQMPLEVTVGAREVLRQAVPRDLVPDERSAKEFLVADADELRAVHFPVPDKEFAYPEPRYEIDVEAVDDGGSVDVVVTAQTLVRDLLLQADRLGADAVCDTGLRTLLPGERARFRVRGAGHLTADAVRGALFSVAPR
jgi:beta-mannosidase